MSLNKLVKGLVEAITKQGPDAVQQAIKNIVNAVDLEYESFPIQNIKKCGSSLKYSSCDNIFFIEFTNGNCYHYESLWDSRRPQPTIGLTPVAGGTAVKLTDTKDFFDRMLKDITTRTVVDLSDEEIDNMKDALLIHDVIHWYRNTDLNVDGYSTDDLVGEYVKAKE